MWEDFLHRAECRSSCTSETGETEGGAGGGTGPPDDTLVTLWQREKAEGRPAARPGRKSTGTTLSTR